jgi:hypothetical protein
MHKRDIATLGERRSDFRQLRRRHAGRHHGFETAFVSYDGIALCFGGPLAALVCDWVNADHRNDAITSKRHAIVFAPYKRKTAASFDELGQKVWPIVRSAVRCLWSIGHVF